MQHKATLTNLQQTGECVVNIVDSAAAELMNATCANFAADQDEFAEVGLEKVTSKLVKASGVAISPVRFECKLREVICISDQPMGGSMMLLDVVAIHTADRCLTGKHIDTLKVDAVGKMGGSFYSTTDNSFELHRP
jgi:flavin reductase (DIM6/NTAB) family NADH-FMN oxidoreductase RutF